MLLRCEILLNVEVTLPVREIREIGGRLILKGLDSCQILLACLICTVQKDA